MADPAIFEAGDVRVTRTVADIAGTSYPIAGIVSVSVRRPDRGLLAAGLFLTALALFSFLAPGESKGSGLLVAVGLVLAYLGWRRPTRLVIATAGAERVALKSTNAQFLEATRDAILQAVSQRG